MEEQSLLIALLEWELAASQAREAEWRDAWRTMRNDAYRTRPSTREPQTIKPGTPPARYSAGEVVAVKARAFARLDVLCEEPADDRRLRQRLESARWEAMQAAGGGQ